MNASVSVNCCSCKMFFLIVYIVVFISIFSVLCLFLCYIVDYYIYKAFREPKTEE